MKIKKSSGDKEHSLRLLPCFGRRSRHPHQEKQLVNGLVHSFRKMLQQFIWDAIWTRCFSIFQVSHLVLKYARVTHMFQK
ncbi:TPA: hypothetical protein ACH3X3_001237 [Trebouxia sp. C0006]